MANRWLTVAEKRLAELVATNTPLSEICEVIGRDRWTTRRNIHYLARRPPPAPKRSPLRLSLAEREEISRGVAVGRGTERSSRYCPPSTVGSGVGCRQRPHVIASSHDISVLAVNDITEAGRDVRTESLLILADSMVLASLRRLEDSSRRRSGESVLDRDPATVDCAGHGRRLVDIVAVVLGQLFELGGELGPLLAVALEGGCELRSVRVSESFRGLGKPLLAIVEGLEQVLAHTGVD